MPRFQLLRLEDRVNPGFGTPVSYATPSNAASVVAADLNGDGFLDLAVGSTGGVATFRGNGNGTFQARVDYGLNGGFPVVTRLADLTGDGRPEIITANEVNYDCAVLKNNGDGTFQAATYYTTNPGAKSLAVADFNGDGKLDVAVGRLAGAAIFLGNGSGGLGTAITYATGSYPYGLAAGDFNGDGKADLVAGQLEADNLAFLLGNGNGSFPPRTNRATGTNSKPVGVAVGDLNGDGKADVVAGLDGTGSIGVLLGNGDGTFAALTTLSMSGRGARPVLADFNLDGKLDVATYGGLNNDVAVRLGNGDGSFGAVTLYPCAASGTDIVAGDFNGDGLIDLGSTGGTSPGSVAVILNTFPPPVTAQFTVSAPASATAGVSFSVIVTAQTSGGAIAPNYRGTVAFGSSDGQAILPENYAFTAADAGRHTFTVTLKLAGNRSVTVSAGVSNGAATVTVNAAAATALVLSGVPASVAAGQVFGTLVTAQDSYGNTAVSYRGTVSFSSNDGQAVLPINYAFTAGDSGVKAFPTLSLQTAGSRTLQASDGTLATGAATVTVNAAAASKLAFLQQPLGTTVGTALDPPPTVRLTDPFGNAVMTTGTTLTLAVQAGPGALAGTLTANTANGVATFPGVSLTAGGLYQLRATATGLTATVSATFPVVLLSRILPVGVAGVVYGPTPNASQAEAFVKGLYRTVVGRDGDSAGVTYWAGQLTSGALNRAQVVNSFWNSRENREREVNGYYLTFLGRPAEPAGLDYWVNRLQTGGSEEEIVLNFLRSPESNSAPDDEFVRRLYRGALGREGAAAEVMYWVGQLQSGVSRAQVAGGFVYSAEAAGISIDADYLAYLRREPEAAGRAFYVGEITAKRRTYAAVAQSLLASDEFWGNAAL